MFRRGCLFCIVEQGAEIEGRGRKEKGKEWMDGRGRRKEENERQRKVREIKKGKRRGGIVTIGREMKDVNGMKVREGE